MITALLSTTEGRLLSDAPHWLPGAEHRVLQPTQNNQLKQQKASDIPRRTMQTSGRSSHQGGRLR